MKCPNCNFEVAENTKFCPECGTKMPEIVEAISSENVTEENPNTPSTIETDKKKKAKKKKIKKIIIISVSALLACGIIYLVLYLVNPFCIFGHNMYYSSSSAPTCGSEGYDEYACSKCDHVYRERLGNANLEHKWDTVPCGTENHCTICGEKKTLQHKFEFDDSCDYCGKELFTINFSQTLPTTISEDNTSKVVITNIEVNSYPSVSRDTFITFSIKKTYDRRGNSYSAYGKIGWKLSDSNGKVLDSGTGYSNGQLCVGEESEVVIKVSYLDYWSEYRLELLDID